MRGVNPLKHVLLDEGVVEIPPELEEWLRYWWGYSIKKMRPNDWFEVEGDNLFCTPAPATAETVIELPSSASVSIPHDISPPPNDFFVEETDGEGGGPVF